MKSLGIFTTLIFITINLQSQNLIPNPSFETTIDTYCGIMNTADFNNTFTDWNSPTDGSPDLYFTNISDDCYNYQPNSQYTGPIGLKGTQTPRTGSVMAGIGVYSIEGLNQREYIQTKLTSPMIVGNTYQISYFVSLADFIEFSIDKIGVHFSIEAIDVGSNNPLDVTPQIENQIILGDAQNWMLVTELYEAEDTYEYLTIGNFKSDNNTTLFSNPNASGAPGTYGSYYFLDDFVVMDLTTVAVKDFDDLGAKIFPNPTTESLNVTFGQNLEEGKISISNINGQVIYTLLINNASDVLLDISRFPKGTYQLSIESNEEIYVSRFMKI